MARVLVLSILPKVRMIKGCRIPEMNTRRLQPQTIGNARKFIFH